MPYSIEQLVERYPALKPCESSIKKAFDVLRNSYEADGKLLVCGNGGSAADSEHIVGELMKGFKNPRKLNDQERAALMSIAPAEGELLANGLQRALPAVSLVGHPGLSTAFLNDVSDGGAMAFAQQTYGLGRKGDVLLGISTSGNSKNVVLAAIAAKSKGMFVIALTGEKESRLSGLANVTIRVPETETFKVQEYHLPIYHCLCLMLEEHFFGVSAAR